MTRICNHCRGSLRPNGIAFSARKSRVQRKDKGRKYWEIVIRVECHFTNTDDEVVVLNHIDCIEAVVEKLKEPA